jgi:hypothetical protein
MKTYRAFAPQRFPTSIKRGITESGIKALLLDARMKNLPEDYQIKVFRLFRGAMRRTDPSDPSKSNSYDIHFHYIPVHKNGLVEKEMIYPIIKKGATPISFSEAGIDEYELQKVMIEILESMFDFNRDGNITQCINDCKIHHKGNFEGDKNPFVYEINDAQNDAVKNAFIRLIRAAGTGNRRDFDINIGAAIEFKIAQIEKLKGDNDNTVQNVDTSAF